MGGGVVVVVELVSDCRWGAEEGRMEKRRWESVQRRYDLAGEGMGVLNRGRCRAPTVC